MHFPYPNPIFLLDSEWGGYYSVTDMDTDFLGYRKWCGVGAEMDLKNRIIHAYMYLFYNDY
jgi:hypothetical protein